ncbi:hypothetical protein HJC23_009545 [Cyclotella cryptica]|uniref:GLTSCR protein conserved domain-containing protein n=1 Tax=Cyclotella cryptica TaxID=29204 RepID=A0ABD3Q4W5_9STRA
MSAPTTPSTQSPPAPAAPIVSMSTFITNIIDCVARPSTSDSPVRLLKAKSLDNNGGGSPTCVSASIDASENNSLVARSSTSMDGVATAVFPVSTAEAVDNEDDYLVADDNTLSSLDNNIRQQFEAAFATFLYKNPAFTSMSHANLTRLRSKLAKESARNARAESELRQQLAMLKENKRRTELDLQRELLVVTRAKAAREAELRNQIWKVRLESMAVDEEARRIKNDPSYVRGSSGKLQQQGQLGISHGVTNYGDCDFSSNALLSMNLYPEITDSDSFQAELNRSRIEYERLSGEIERLKEMMQGSLDE